jgi:uncharacterized protein YndB with AHSA1/START domain
MEAPATEISTSRLLNTSREQVWEAWTNPDLLARWWGPEGFTNTFHLFEPRPGGNWKLTMHAPDGANYENRFEFRELVKPECIVLEHIDPAHSFRLYAAFEAREAQTFLTFRMVFADAEEYERVKPYVSEANEQNLDRLEKVLLPATGR